MPHDKERSARIATLNDTFRKVNSPLGQWMFTAGVDALGSDFLMQVVDAVRAFDAFTKDNDPYGEHDFGALEVQGKNLFWKINCYEKGSNHEAGAETPEDAHTTDRVLTIMLVDEY